MTMKLGTFMKMIFIIMTEYQKKLKKQKAAYMLGLSKKQKKEN